MAAAIEYVLFVLICQAVICAIGLLIGCFGMFMFFGQIIQQKLCTINENLVEDISNHLEMQNDLCSVIGFHSDVKKLSQFETNTGFAFRLLSNFMGKIQFVSDWPMNIPMWLNLTSHYILFGAFWPLAFRF